LNFVIQEAARLETAKINSWVRGWAMPLRDVLRLQRLISVLLYYCTHPLLLFTDRCLLLLSNNTFYAGLYYMQLLYNHHANEHHPLFIGVAQVLEFPKELNCEINCSRPEFRKGASGAAEDSDVMRSYLVTSRDGRRFDFDWIYAKQPLLPPPIAQRAQ
jgi:hypothetical protein